VSCDFADDRVRNTERHEDRRFFVRTRVA